MGMSHSKIIGKLQPCYWQQSRKVNDHTVEMLIGLVRVTGLKFLWGKHTKTDISE
jgi:hypothetical protein